MNTRSVHVRTAARRDLETATDWYRDHPGDGIAARFVNAAQAAFGAVARMPGAGSPRFAHELGLPGIRTRRLSGFPYLIFYIVAPRGIEIWRVLHAQRDIPASLFGDPQ